MKEIASSAFCHSVYMSEYILPLKINLYRVMPPSWHQWTLTFHLKGSVSFHRTPDLMTKNSLIHGWSLSIWNWNGPWPVKLPTPEWTWSDQMNYWYVLYTRWLVCAHTSIPLIQSLSLSLSPSIHTHTHTHTLTLSLSLSLSLSLTHIHTELLSCTPGTQLGI